MFFNTKIFKTIYLPSFAICAIIACCNTGSFTSNRNDKIIIAFPSEEEINVTERGGINNYGELLSRAMKGSPDDIVIYVKVLLNNTIPWDGAATELGMRNLLNVIEINGDSKFSDIMVRYFDDSDLRKLHYLIFKLIDPNLKHKFPKTFSGTNIDP